MPNNLIEFLSTACVNKSIAGSKKFLKQALFIITAILALNTIAKAQSDKIESEWFNDAKDAKIQIYKSTDGKFYGKIIWLKDPLKNGKPKLDEKNPDKKVQRQQLVGLVILRGFQKEGDKYTDGTIYDPENGKTYDCKMNHNGKKLAIRGFIGFSLFGRTTVWEKAS
jgi:uncharacterized protein (DUF2147 family)